MNFLTRLLGAQADPLEPHVVYATSQNGNLGVVDKIIEIKLAEPEMGCGT